VNPQHLEPVTRKVNLARGEIHARRKAQSLTITHCPQGHPYSGDNLSINRAGSRVCRECKRSRIWIRRRSRAILEGRKILPVASERTHCPNGHPYEGVNLRIAKNGQRVCKACTRAWALKHYHMKKLNN
jgi:hypothetical protein